MDRPVKSFTSIVEAEDVVESVRKSLYVSEGGRAEVGKREQQFGTRLSFSVSSSFSGVA